MDLSKIKQLRSYAEFDQLDDLIVIEDVETEVITYRNPAYLRETKSFTGDYPAYDKRFFTIDSTLSTVEGKAVVIEVARPVLPASESGYNAVLRTAISDIENVVRSEVTENFLTSKYGRTYHDYIFDRIARLAMEYYQAPYAQLFIFSDGLDKPGKLFQYELNNPVEPSYKFLPLNDYWKNSLDNFFIIGYSLICENIAGFGAFDPDLERKFADRGIHTVVITPFFAEKKLIGFFIISNPKSEGDETDFFLLDFATNALGSMVYRGRLFANTYFDDITGFPWMGSVEYFYPRFLDDHKDLPITIFQFDFLHFRMMARSYGNNKGDEILKYTAKILREKYSRALVARKNGSDIFVVITTGVAENIAIEANKLIDELKSGFPDIALVPSFGVYQVKDRDEDLDYSLLKVSTAHRNAKEDPFGRIKIFDEKMGEREARGLFYTNRFRESLEKGEFQVYIQPKYNLETKKYFGGEALVRWSIDGNMVSPGEFIPLFESNGICRELDIYVLEKVCELVKGWLDHDPEHALPISVNFSRVDFADPALFERIIYIINEYKVPTDYIEIEITESAYVDYEPQIMSFLSKCHSAGIRVLMDDFGSGVSSFNSLKNLNVDILKLDYKFLSATGDNAKKRKIIEGICSMARTIGTPLIVEGVETHDEAAFFHSLGIRYVQGYLFGKPMPIPQFEQLANRAALFEVTEIFDERMLYHEILDSSSNVSLLLNQIDIFAAIFRFDGNHLFPILLNKRLEQGVSSLIPVDTFMSNDLLSFVTPEVRNACLRCLMGTRSPYVFTARHRITFNFGISQQTLFVSSMLLQKTPDGQEYYLFQGTTALNGLGEYEDAPVGVNDLSVILNSAVQGCVITDPNGYIVKFNDFIYDRFPNAEVGKHVLAVFGNNIGNAARLRRIYDVSTDAVYEIESKAGTYQDKPAYALVFVDLGKPNSYVCEFGGKGFKFYDRMIATVCKVALAYVEIDLEEDRFIEVHMDKAHAEEYGAVFQTGSYSEGLYPRFARNVRTEDVLVIKERFALSALIDACSAMSPFNVTYKMKGKNEFHRIDIKFYYDFGHRYCCFFLEDVTESCIRDYDSLTGCLGRTAGMRLMDKYIANHSLDKMAFIVLDIDRFKELNDAFGHPIGDKVLAKAYDAFHSLSKGYLYGTRIGGDEFCVLLSNRGDGVSADSIREELQNAFRNIGFEVGINRELSISCGVAMIPENGGTVSALYPIADGDLYEQKHLKKLKR